MIDQIHHLATIADWEQRSGAHYRPAGLDAEGFIHLCTAAQLPGVVERYYTGRNDLMLLTVRTDRLDAPLVWEDTTGSGERFPHLYGPLALAAVLAATPFPGVASSHFTRSDDRPVTGGGHRQPPKRTD